MRPKPGDGWGDWAANRETMNGQLTIPAESGGCFCRLEETPSGSGRDASWGYALAGTEMRCLRDHARGRYGAVAVHPRRKTVCVTIVLLWSKR